MKLFFGKIPQKKLEDVVFKFLGAKREDVIVGPSIGEDAAIVSGGKIMIASSCDPVSGASKMLGWIAVNVSANDVATCGVKPLWFNSCILLPAKSNDSVLEEICFQMDAAAKKLTVAIIGGHTEITPSIINPIVVGSCMGIVENNRYFRSNGAKPGSKIVMTKGVGIEGTGILANDREDVLRRRLEPELLKRSQKYLDWISVVPECLCSASHRGVQSMHDLTEGGLAGGLFEMADASKCGFKIYEEEIIIRSETQAICDVFEIDPLRLISSGSLLIIVENKYSEHLISELKKRDIECSIIGEVLENEQERIIVKRNKLETRLEHPVFDELWSALNKRVK